MKTPGRQGALGTDGAFHIIGLGGIGMSAIAEVMRAQGYDVQGSDQRDGANLRRLAAMGVRVFAGHDPANLKGVAYVIISTAVKPGNPELDAALAAGLPVLSRAEMLAEIMRGRATISVTGTHGKTTTTSLTAFILESAGLDPTVITGGIVNSWGSNARTGRGEWMVVEADESDGTFTRLPTQVGVVTNIDPEHLDHHGSVEALHAAFEAFIGGIPFYGLAVACIDHPVVREMIQRIGRVRNGRRMLTYGRAADADLRLENTRIADGVLHFDAWLGPKMVGGERWLRDLVLRQPGEHNALNALAAIAAANEAGVSDDALRRALRAFEGVKRRFTYTGSWADISVYDDYAHHPAEIAAALNGARAVTKGRVIAVMQPHRYSRLKSLFADFCLCFDSADAVLIAPVYSAGEAPNGVDSEALAAGVRAAGHGSVTALESEAELAPTIAGMARPGDLVIGLGAGSISEWTYALPGRLEALRQRGAAE
jgi:UDP-N-acetylmuramate--alanine ligase